MSGVFQNIDPPPPHPRASVYPPAFGAGGGHTALYSTYVSTLWLLCTSKCWPVLQGHHDNGRARAVPRGHGGADAHAQAILFYSILLCAGPSWRWTRVSSSPWTWWSRCSSSRPRPRSARSWTSTPRRLTTWRAQTDSSSSSPSEWCTGLKYEKSDKIACAAYDYCVVAPNIPVILEILL